MNSKGWNSQAHREFPGKFESSNLSRDDLSREIGRRTSAEISGGLGSAPLEQASADESSYLFSFRILRLQYDPHVNICRLFRRARSGSARLDSESTVIRGMLLSLLLLLSLLSLLLILEVV